MKRLRLTLMPVRALILPKESKDQGNSLHCFIHNSFLNLYNGDWPVKGQRLMMLAACPAFNPQGLFRPGLIMGPVPSENTTSALLP